MKDISQTFLQKDAVSFLCLLQGFAVLFKSLNSPMFQCLNMPPLSKRSISGSNMCGIFLRNRHLGRFGRVSGESAHVAFHIDPTFRISPLPFKNIVCLGCPGNSPPFSEVRFDGETYLAYKTWPLHVALLRGTTADMDGRLDDLKPGKSANSKERNWRS